MADHLLLPVPDDHDEDPEEAEMERMMALQEDQENLHDEHDEDAGVDDFDDDLTDAEDAADGGNFSMPSRSFVKLHYSSVSFTAAIVHIIYVLRTREQVYLSLLYLTSSKLSYILLGNAVLASFLKIFHNMVNYFMNGLRLMETETIVDHIRWNVTETCIALTMFRQEISVKTLGIFMVLILGKCLHWALELRINHLRMTEEVFYFLNDEDMMMFNSDDASTSSENKEQIWWFWRAIGMFFPKPIKAVAYNVHQALPRVRKNHVKIFCMMNILFCFDMLSLTYCACHLLEDGPSIFIMFIFESAILMVSIMSSSTLYNLHIIDGMINVAQRLIIDRHEEINGIPEDNEADKEDADPSAADGQEEAVANRNGTGNSNQRTSLPKYLLQKIASVWRDQRITGTFIVELMALAAKFLFHLFLFVSVFTLYGLPINIIRDFYLAFMKLKQRLVAFSSYRRLTSNMNTRFESVTTEEQLDAAGRTCIICRERMEVDGIHGDCKMLPVCNHAFHKHCLREWLVQQQSCPTCRADIQANEARAKTMAASNNDDEKEEEGEDAASNDNAQKSDISPERDLNDTSATERFSKQDTSNDKTNLILCKVIAPGGTSIFELNEDVEEQQNYSSKRDLQCGIMIVCTESRKFAFPNDSEGEKMKIYRKTPDGWVLASDVEEVFHVKSQVTS